MAQHLSVRVPWKDNGYDGFVCDKPCYNNACLRLKNIAENRDETYEETIAGSPIKGHESKMPCLSEGGCFMSDCSYSKMNNHPYIKNNAEKYGHYQETELIYPAFSLPGRPFRWTMLNVNGTQNINMLCERYNIPFDLKREPPLGDWNNWVQDAANQRAMFKAFYSDVTPNKSLVVPYVK